jgi:hypothetical protein
MQPNTHNSVSTNQKNSSALFIAGGLLIIFIAIFFTWYFSNRQAQDNIQSPSAIIPTEKKLSDQLAGRSVYTNEDYGFMLNYPEAYSISTEEGTADGAHFIYGVTLADQDERPVRIEVRPQNEKSAELEYQRWRLVGHVTDKIIAENETTVNNNEAIALEYEVGSKREIKVVIFASEFTYTISGEKNSVADIISRMEIF